MIYSFRNSESLRKTNKMNVQKFCKNKKMILMCPIAVCSERRRGSLSAAVDLLSKNLKIS